jgi:hypothetical protein
VARTRKGDGKRKFTGISHWCNAKKIRCISVKFDYFTFQIISAATGPAVANDAGFLSRPPFEFMAGTVAVFHSHSGNKP